MNKIEQELEKTIDKSRENGGFFKIELGSATKNSYPLLEKHCIGFAKWTQENGYKYQSNNLWTLPQVIITVITTEELFELYKTNL